MVLNFQISHHSKVLIPIDSQTKNSLICVIISFFIFQFNQAICKMEFVEKIQNFYTFISDPMTIIMLIYLKSNDINEQFQSLYNKY